MASDPEAQASVHEALLAKTFLEVADTLVDRFDLIDTLTALVDRSVELFDVAAAGVLLGDNRGKLRVVAASSEEIRLLELLQVQNDEGPCLDCYREGRPVIAHSLRTGGKWPVFTRDATASHFDGVLAVPLRLRGTTLGAMGLFQREGGRWPEHFLPVIESLAAVASITILQDQAANRSEALVIELQHALDSRVVIEQAKGMIAEHARAEKIDMDKAFNILRSYARNHGLRLTDVARDLVSGALSLKVLVGPADA